MGYLSDIVIQKKTAQSIDEMNAEKMLTGWWGAKAWWAVRGSGMSRRFTPRHAQASIDIQNTALSSGQLGQCRVTTAENNSIHPTWGT